MNNNVRAFLLKSIPYLLSVAGGVVLFWVTTDQIADPNLRDLVNNIAASLLAIPLVFLLYDYSNYRISIELKKTLATTTHDKIIMMLLDLVLQLRNMMGLRGMPTLAQINKMGDMGVAAIAARIKIRPGDIEKLRVFHRQIDDLVYRNNGGEVLPLVQIQALSNLGRQILHMINVCRFHQRAPIAAQAAHNIIAFIIDWLDSDASFAMHFQQLLGADLVSNGGQGGDKNGENENK